MTGIVARTVAPTAESTEWAGLAAMADLLANGTGSRLATVLRATFVTGDGHGARHILGEGNPDDTITVSNAREGLVAAAGDHMDLTERQEEALHHVVGHLGRAVAKIN